MTNWAHDMITREVMYLTRDCGMNDLEAEIEAIRQIRSRADGGDGEAQRIVREMDEPQAPIFEDYDENYPERYIRMSMNRVSSKPLPKFEGGI